MDSEPIFLVWCSQDAVAVYLLVKLYTTHAGYLLLPAGLRQAG